MAIVVLYLDYEYNIPFHINMVIQKLPDNVWVIYDYGLSILNVINILNLLYQFYLLKFINLK